MPPLAFRTRPELFTFANAVALNSDLVLKASGDTAAEPSNFIRVQANGSQVVVATTTNSGLSYTTRGTLSGTFASGDIMTARADATGTVFVWKTTGGTDTYLGSVAITPNTGWTGNRPNRHSVANQRSRRRLRRRNDGLALRG